MTKAKALDSIEWHNPRSRLRAKAKYEPAGVPIDDMRCELAEYYEGDPPDGYVPMLDDTDLIMEDMVRFVEELTDEEVQKRYLKFKAGVK